MLARFLKPLTSRRQLPSDMRPQKELVKSTAVIADCLHGKTGEKKHWLVTGNTKRRWEDSF